MGSGTYNASATRHLLSATRRAGGSVMGYTAAVNSGVVEAKVNSKLDPSKKNRDGIIIRESRDSEQHPNSVPVAVIFDTTGSMMNIPEIFINQLPNLMELIIKQKYLADPQVLFGAVNDATTDPYAALEIGQFESGNQMDDVLTNILLQGGGGGSNQESYELAMYFMARHTSMDSFEKRKKKGYLFIIGDETPYNYVSKDEVKRWIGEDIQDNIPTKDILKELQAKFNVFWLFPGTAQNGDDKGIQNQLKELFGQRFMLLKDPEDICTAIAATVAISEGRDPHVVVRELQEGLKDKKVTDAVQAVVDGIPPRNLDEL